MGGSAYLQLAVVSVSPDYSPSTTRRCRLLHRVRMQGGANQRTSRRRRRVSFGVRILLSPSAFYM